MLHPLAALLAENALVHVTGEVFHPVFVVVGALLTALYGLVPSFGFAIAFLTVLVMAVLTPLTIKSTRSMMAMQRLQPEFTRLRQKYKGPENRERLNHELTRLYREHGVSPAGSCLPALLQMPFLIVLYDVIRGLTTTIRTTVRGHPVTVARPRYLPTSSRMYHHLVATHGAMNWFAIDLALKPFSAHAQWFGCLPYLGLVAAAVVLQYVQMAQMTRRNPAAAPTTTHVRTMQGLMPLFFVFIYLVTPAAVVLYMIVSTAIRIGTQELLFRAGVVGPPPSARTTPGSVA